MEEQEKKKETTSGLEKLNKIITGVCAFLLVLVVNDIRSSISDIKAEVKQASALYQDLNTRVTIIEYSMGIKPKDKSTSLLRSEVTNPLYAHAVFTKPEEYEFKGPSEQNSQ
jgi:hypothetical protein